ncbi:MAG: hypothetical protein R6X33_07460 [Candidatus Brocadiia bacterium]
MIEADELLTEEGVDMIPVRKRALGCVVAYLLALILGAGQAVAVDDPSGFGFASVGTLQEGDRFVYQVRVPRDGVLGRHGAAAGYPRRVARGPEDFERRFLLVRATERRTDDGAEQVRFRIVEVNEDGTAEEPIWRLQPVDGDGYFGRYYALRLTRKGPVTAGSSVQREAYRASLSASVAGMQHPFLGYPPFTQSPAEGTQEAILFRDGELMRCAVRPAEDGEVRVDVQYYRRVQWSDRESSPELLYLDERTGELLEESPRPMRPSLVEEKGDELEEPNYAPGERGEKQRERWLEVVSKKRPPEDVLPVRPVDTEVQTWEEGMPLPSEVFRKAGSGHLRMKLTLIERPERYGPLETKE